METKATRRMQPTMKPSWLNWSGWDEFRREHLEGYKNRRMRLALRDWRDLNLQSFIDWQHLPRQEVNMLTPKQMRHLISLKMESANVEASESTWHQDRYSLNSGSWSLTNVERYRLHSNRAVGSLNGLGAEGSADGAAGSASWEGALRGGAAGAMLLAALVLLARALDRCMHTNVCRVRRRRSQEWPTPTVLATSNQVVTEVSIESDSFQQEADHDDISDDLPPPYYECGHSSYHYNIDRNKPQYEDAPPPYSTCSITYNNHAVPSVHFCHRRRENTYEDNGQTSTQNVDETASCSNANRQYVFQNGRILERSPVRESEINIDNETNVPRPDDNVEQANTEVTVLNTNTNATVPNRVLPV